MKRRDSFVMHTNTRRLSDVFGKNLTARPRQSYHNLGPIQIFIFTDTDAMAMANRGLNLV